MVSSAELEQPLISSGSSVSTNCNNNASPLNGPRILDRDGTFSQSRGRWSVASTNARSAAYGSARQRRSATASAAASNVTDVESNNAGSIPYGVDTLPRRVLPSRSRPSFWDRLCCGYNNRSCLCRPSDQPRLGRRCWDDWFHSISYTPTCLLMLGIFVAYFITIVIFAGLYLSVNKVGMHYADTGGEGGDGGGDNNVQLGDSDVDVPSFCGMEINNHMEALYFSLSTMATIGYGTSDYYFGDCWTPFILVLLQVFAAIVFSSLAIGLLFQRMSRGQKRGRTIVFSDVAVIRKVRGR